MHLKLFGTSGCHLCEEAEHMLNEYLSAEPKEIIVETVDIADQEYWQERYALRIPVLYHPQSGRELAWPFDLPQLEEFISQINASLLSA
ncbi:MAG: glutaredoxin family protein [Methylosarcina sp.]